MAIEEGCNQRKPPVWGEEAQKPGGVVELNPRHAVGGVALSVYPDEGRARASPRSEDVAKPALTRIARRAESQSRPKPKYCSGEDWCRRKSGSSRRPTGVSRSAWTA